MCEKKFLKKADIFYWLADHFVDNHQKEHLIYSIFADILRFFETNKENLNYSGLVGLQKDINKILREGIKDDKNTEAKPTICLCWLSECDCQFQRHKGTLTLCESVEIWKKCTSKKDEDINYGGE